MIEFLLNNEKVSLLDIDPNTTVLEYLREHRQLQGTKEGCASGDCGACTVVIAQLDDQFNLNYLSANACITLVSALDQKQLIIIEDLKSEQKLHKCQQAMVDQDGSQCGFCTPGFVMSLFALHKTHPAYDRQKVQQALAGNLCRCTGYRAIDSAAQQCLDETDNDQFYQLRTQSIHRLKNIQEGDDNTLDESSADEVALRHGQSTCHHPSTLKKLSDLLLAHPKAKIIAGGTDLAITITQHHQKYQQLVSVKYLPELQQHSIDDDYFTLGAAVSLQQCMGIFSSDYPDFTLLLERFASLQVRNHGTIGGNIGNASPIGDCPPPLIALQASLGLRKGEVYREIPLEEYFVDYRKTQLQPSEFIEKVIVPRYKTPFHFKIYKISKRLDDDISAVCGAFFMQLNEQRQVTAIRLAFGGMAAIAKRATYTEQALLGKTWSEQVIKAAQQALIKDFRPLSDFRASREYRLRIAQNLLQKFYIETTINVTDAQGSSTAQSDTQGKTLAPPSVNTHTTRIFEYV